MKTFVLILMLSGYHSVSVTTQEFTSLEKCEFAINSFKHTKPWDTSLTYVCVEK